MAVIVEACVSHYRMGWHILPFTKKVMRKMCDASRDVGGGHKCPSNSKCPNGILYVHKAGLPGPDVFWRLSGF